MKVQYFAKPSGFWQYGPTGSMFVVEAQNRFPPNVLCVLSASDPPTMANNPIVANMIFALFIKSHLRMKELITGKSDQRINIRTTRHGADKFFLVVIDGCIRDDRSLVIRHESPSAIDTGLNIRILFQLKIVT